MQNSFVLLPPPGTGDLRRETADPSIKKKNMMRKGGGRKVCPPEDRRKRRGGTGRFKHEKNARRVAFVTGWNSYPTGHGREGSGRGRSMEKGEKADSGQVQTMRAQTPGDLSRQNGGLGGKKDSNVRKEQKGKLPPGSAKKRVSKPTRCVDSDGPGGGKIGERVEAISSGQLGE